MTSDNVLLFTSQAHTIRCSLTGFSDQQQICFPAINSMLYLISNGFFFVFALFNTEFLRQLVGYYSAELKRLENKWKHAITPLTNPLVSISEFSPEAQNFRGEMPIGKMSMSIT